MKLFPFAKPLRALAAGLALLAPAPLLALDTPEGKAEAAVPGAAAHAPVPGRDGFSLLADRLASIRFTVQVTCAAPGDRPHAETIQALLPAALTQLNRHLGRDRLTLAPAIAPGPEGASGRAGLILVRVDELEGDVAGFASPLVHGFSIRRGTFAESCGGTIQVHRLHFGKPALKATLPHVLLHELIHVLGGHHFDEPYRGGIQVMRSCGPLFCNGDPEHPELLALVRAQAAKEGISPEELDAVRRHDPAAFRRQCEEALREFTLQGFPATLGEGDINALRHLSRGDRIDAATGEFTPGDTPEAAQERLEKRAASPCGRCVIL